MSKSLVNNIKEKMKTRLGTMVLDSNGLNTDVLPPVPASLALERKSSSIMDTLKHTYKKEGNKELQGYVGYLAEDASHDIIEEQPSKREDE